MNTNNIVQKLWNYCNVLRDDGMSYGDYVEPLALTLALPRKREREFSWGDELFDHYHHTLEQLGRQKGLLGLIFNKSHGGIRS